MMPVLFSWGPFHLYSFGLMVALGLGLTFYLVTPWARKTGFPHPNKAADLVLVTVISGFLGARLYYGLQYLSVYLENPLAIFAVWEGGLIFYGGVLGSLLGLWIFSRLKSLSFLEALDFLIPFVAGVHGFGRIGCFLNGCCGGRACDLPWAVRFPPEEVAVHPTQLYEAVFNFALFFFLLNRYSHRTFKGQIIAFYFLFYAVGRFVIEFFRVHEIQWAGLSSNQWVSLVIFGGGIFFYVYARSSANGGTTKQSKRPPESHPRPDQG
ncbi:MAG: prolipoprotein diacylglyceryl transferase [Candidatus Omnitrophica bacterium]|nr:prolipoprotein diacylglyceryl transferase [Candidatus Omnitrophota bacterium]